MANIYAEESTNTSSNPFEAVKSTKRALHTFEQAAMGFDPSTGRTPVEQTNNYARSILTPAAYTSTIKGAPGFLHKLSILTNGAQIAATHLVLYDYTSASGTAIIDVIPMVLSDKGLIVRDYDEIFTTGLAIAACTVNNADGVVTNAALTASTTVAVNVAFR